MAPPAKAERLPWRSARDIFQRVAHRRDVAWLDSSLTGRSDCRFSILAWMPSSILTLRGDAWRIHNVKGGPAGGPCGGLDMLNDWLARPTTLPTHASHLPFAGGAIGWLSYDLARAFERLDGSARDDLGCEDVRLAWYDAALVWDHAHQELWRVAHSDADPETIAALGAAAAELFPAPPDEPPLSSPTPRSDLPRPAYLAGVSAIREGIARGEYYQLNLVQRFTCEHQGHPSSTYLRFREINPAPFSAYLAADDTAVLCGSPERFLEVTPDGLIRTCPIKGTRPRGATPAEDARQREELLTSDKERAELLMIVDLLRNDLGRVCQPGSVEVRRLHHLESFATVHHLLGEVTGRLRPGVSCHELLRSVFPGGSITGAPKVSAMRAIDVLEPHRRGIAMGSVGCFSAHGRIDLNICIRTIVIRAGIAYVSVGAGIVWDSDPAAEYAETLTKARAQFAALGIAEFEP